MRESARFNGGLGCHPMMWFPAHTSILWFIVDKQFLDCFYSPNQVESVLGNIFLSRTDRLLRAWSTLGHEKQLSHLTDRCRCLQYNSNVQNTQTRRIARRRIHATRSIVLRAIQQLITSPEGEARGEATDAHFRVPQRRKGVAPNKGSGYECHKIIIICGVITASFIRGASLNKRYVDYVRTAVISLKTYGF